MESQLHIYTNFFHTEHLAFIDISLAQHFKSNKLKYVLLRVLDVASLRLKCYVSVLSKFQYSEV